MDLDFDELEEFPIVTGRRLGQKNGHFQYIRRRNMFTHRTRSQNYACDWNMLASCSPVLEAWVRWEPTIKTSGNLVLSLFSKDENAITQLIDYMQGRKIKVTNEDVYELLCLADMLQVDDVSNYCKHCLANLDLTKNNFHKILNACSTYNFEHEEMDQFIRGNLTELCTESGILTICPDAVEWLLTDDELSYWPMDDRFVFITHWCNTNECRTVYFEKWFDHLDFDKIDKDIIEVVVKNDDIVRKSVRSLSKVNAYLCDRRDAPVPFVITLNDIRTGSNAIGFNLEDKQLYKFKFPDRMMMCTSVTTVLESGKLAWFDQLQRCFYEYDINTKVEIKKKISSRRTSIFTHMLDANDRLILICKSQEELQVWNRFNRTNRRLKRGSVLHQLVNDDKADSEIEPLLSLTFDVSCACFLHTSIVMSTTTYSKRSKLFFFNLRTNQLIEMDINIGGSFGRQLTIKRLLPIHGKLLLILQSELLLLSVNEEKRTCIQDRYISEENSLADGNPSYIFFSDFIISLSSKNIRLCYSGKDENDTCIKNWCSFELNRLNFNNARPVIYAFIKRTRPLCHKMCPHCDPNAWQKEEESLKLQEVLENRDYTDYFDRDYDDDDYDYDYVYGYNDDDYGYNDDYYGYNDDPWNQRELIWDGSADEFVEAWW